MGFKYGERADYDIRANTDVDWAASVKYCKGSIEELKSRIEKYKEQVEFFSPQTIEFLKGMANGAASQLDKSEYAKEGTNLERIYNINISSALVKIPTGCNGFWVGKQATKDGKSYATFHSQGRYMGNDIMARHITFVAIPDDPKAHIVWMSTIAGCIGRGGEIVNDAGVVNGLFASDSGDYPEEVNAYGVEPHLSRFHALLYGDSAEKAAEIINLGTPEYREKTGRKTLLRARGVTLMFADAGTCLMVSYTAGPYAIRRPGDLGEEGAGYICQSNHNYQEFSYDENNEKTNIPMTKFAPEETEKKDSSYWRFWSPMWAIRNNYGKIDLEMVLRELTALHDRYDKDGNKYEYEQGKSFCAHKFSKAGDPGGSYSPVVVVPETLEIYEVPDWPCRYVNKSWNYINLNDFKALR